MPFQCQHEALKPGSVAASLPDNVQTSADQQIVLLNPFMEAQ